MMMMMNITTYMLLMLPIFFCLSFLVFKIDGDVVYEDGGDSEGGINNVYDRSKWKNPHDALGDFQGAAAQGTNQHCSAMGENVYFRHLMRYFKENMELLPGDDHKYSVQLLMLEHKYKELSRLLEDEQSSNKQLLDAIEGAFQPLAPSVFEPFQQPLTPYLVGVCGAAVSITVVVLMVVWRILQFRFSFGGLMMVILSLLFIISVPWEWHRMYKIALSKKTSDAMKLAEIPATCRPGDLTVIQSLNLWMKDSFSLGDDDCVKYHESLLVDPLWEVTPFQAFSVCLARLVLEPLKQVASAGGECFRLFFKEVPIQYQPFVFIASFILIVLLIIAAAGFQIWTPLLRLHVRQGEERIASGDRHLQIENDRLRQQVELLRREQDRLAIYKDKDEDGVEDLGELHDNGMAASAALENQLSRPQRQPQRQPQLHQEPVPRPQPQPEPEPQVQPPSLPQCQPPQRSPVENEQPRSMRQDNSFRYDQPE